MPKSKPTTVKLKDEPESQDEPQNENEEPEDYQEDDAIDSEVYNSNLNANDKVKYDYQRILVDDIIFVHPDNRRTSEIMTEYELTEVISVRAQQIENTGIVFTEAEGITDPIKLAFKEILDKKCPLDVKRGLTDKIYERWHVNEMAINPDIISSVRNFSSQFIKQ